MASVVVIGGGLLGLPSAWYLLESGHDVTLVERCDAVAQGASYQNGGLITASMPEPWNAPGVHRELLKYLGRSNAPMLLRPSALHNYIGWGLRFLANSTASQYLKTTLANMSLSTFSQDELAKLRASGVVSFSGERRGALKVFRSAASLDACAEAAQPLQDEGLNLEVLDAADTVRKEPVLGEIENELAGSICYPDDETGEAVEFCESLQASLAARGADLVFDCAVDSLIREGSRVRGVATGAGDIDADVVVVAAGVHTPSLLRTAREFVSIKPVKGYSVAVDIVGDAPSFRLPVIDNDMHAAVTPLAGALRLAGTAEFCGWDDRLDPARVDNLFDLLAAMSPSLADAVDRESANPWCGMRPMAADGKPYIGPTEVEGLYVNAGHGHLGWTQAVGSAALLSQLIAGDAPAIDPQPYSPLR